MNIACVVNGAIAYDDTAQLVVRRIAATLVASDHEVDVLRACPDEGAAWDLGLRTRDFAALPARPARAHLLRMVVHPPGIAHEPDCRCRSRVLSGSESLEGEYLDALGGVSPTLADHLAASEYDTVVFVGLVSATSRLVAAVPAASRVIVVPLLSDRLCASLSTATTALRRADAVITFSTEEAVACGRDREAAVPFPLRVEQGALSGVPRGLPQGDFILVMAPWSDPVTGRGWVRHAARLARLLPDVAMVVLTDEFIWPGRWPPELLVRGRGSRADVWRWMHRARAVVDLDPHPLLPRETLEAMLAGAPVLAPVGSVAAQHLVDSGGGVPFRSMLDVSVAVARLADPARREALGAAGTAHARVHTDLDVFTDAVLDAVDGRVAA